jgi:hypothetical protein
MRAGENAIAKGMLAVAGLAVGITLTACSGDDSEEPDQAGSEETVATVDGMDLQECILASAIDRGVYEEVPNPAENFGAEAESAGAYFFEATRAAEGFVYFYALEDPSAASELESTLSTMLEDQGALLAEQVKGASPGTPSVTTEGSVVIGTLPFDESKTDLEEQAVADTADCIEEI